MSKRPLLRQVRVRNYKSLASVLVNLGPFTALVGPNGAGKSNFVDVMSFTRECLLGSVSVALQNRGGINAVRRHSRGHPTNFGMGFQIELEDGSLASYAFEVTAEPQNRFTIKEEDCLVRSAVIGTPFGYKVKAGQFTQAVEGVRSRIEPDRLALPLLSATEEYRPLYDFFMTMHSYSLVPDHIRKPQEPDPGAFLYSDGNNAASVLREVQHRKPRQYERLCELLSKVVPGTSKVEYVSLGQYQTIRFKQDVGDKAPWNFNAVSMSDGTLRALGILLAVYQVNTPSLIAIEEPEATIHPGALDVIVDILKDGGRQTQVLITTHSPDLVENKQINDTELRAVSSNRGRTEIGPIDTRSRKAIRENLYTAGDLLRMQELLPEPVSAEQLRLFDSTFEAAA